ncbi:hypothetical protein [Candidatus Laterigemmans baculatus]|uniref:hypothetical protein n=1 Tax=Candidatus Laterigemmans baculatus TaxID=2770505 RepID=UPI0013DC4BC2|nr:hypothetical protein [Candidatus Laterigemmans baculatus]
MTAQIGEWTLEDAAKQAAGNWRKFESFAWFRRDDIDDPENWAIIYTHNRDSGLLDQSNAAAIAKALEPFEGDVVFESHSHWAVGYVDGFSIRVFSNGEITDAFRRYHELSESLADYPVLDETDYSSRELEATLVNIADAIFQVEEEYELPDQWESEVYHWLSDNRPSAIENCDDYGGYPSGEELKAAFDALGFAQK